MLAPLEAPAEEAGFAAAIASAAAAGEPILVRGNGSKMGMLRPVQAARVLSTANHFGVTLYSPQELIISARAGTFLSNIEVALAEKGQHLIAEPPDYSALLGSTAPQTLGGVVIASSPIVPGVTEFSYDAPTVTAAYAQWAVFANGSGSAPGAGCNRPV